MQKCNACNAAIATVQILDLEGGKVVGSQFLCDACAKSGGAIAKQASISLPSEVLENLLGGLTGDYEPHEKKKSVTCPGCKLTLADFRLRGRLGCPRCYEVFRAALVPLLERVHDSTCHRGRFPGRTSPAMPRPVVSLVELRERLRHAIDEERYEDAAKLRDELEQAKQERDRD